MTSNYHSPEKGQRINSPSTSDDAAGVTVLEPAIQNTPKWLLASILVPTGMACFLVLLALAGEVRKIWIQPSVHAHSDSGSAFLRAEWEREMRGYQEAWSLEVAAQERIRAGWENELLALREQLDREQNDWTRVQAHGTNLKEIPAWDELQPAPHCLQYGTREYTAQILNVPANGNAMSACNATMVEINGQKMCHPLRCENRECNGVFGHWILSDPKCATHFSPLEDKGCRGHIGRFIEATLQGLQPGDDGIAMCLSTPAKYQELQLDAPWSCYQDPLPLFSPVVATWWIYDPECAVPDANTE